jgi:hypothetical protein
MMLYSTLEGRVIFSIFSDGLVQSRTHMTLVADKLAGEGLGSRTAKP